jgi:ABC-type dipeptide/oligopeptide/nickel transport system permease subunit
MNSAIFTHLIIAVLWAITGTCLGFYLGYRRGKSDFLAVFDDFLDLLKANGTMEFLLELRQILGEKVKKETRQ